MAQGLDGIEPCRLARRKEAENDADSAGKEKGEGDNAGVEDKGHIHGLGSEGGGPSALTRKLCDAAVTLEMAPGQSTGVDSYNVSVAAGILCYDVLRRRTAKK